MFFRAARRLSASSSAVRTWQIPTSLIPTTRITVTEVVAQVSLRPTCARSRHRRVATASAASLTAARSTLMARSSCSAASKWTIGRSQCQLRIARHTSRQELGSLRMSRQDPAPSPDWVSSAFRRAILPGRSAASPGHSLKVCVLSLSKIAKCFAGVIGDANSILVERIAGFALDGDASRRGACRHSP